MIKVKGNPLSTDPAEYLTWKLEIIWGVSNVKGQKRTWQDDWSDYSFSGKLGPGKVVIISLGDSKDRLDRFQLYCNIAVFSSCVLFEDTGGWELSPYRYEAKKARWKVRESYLKERWQGYFRRSSYLSGAPIECTMHEQLEWKLWFEEQKQMALESKTFAPPPQAVQLDLDLQMITQRRKSEQLSLWGDGAS